jgi:nucleotide-binding universal stress UspA family protein
MKTILAPVDFSEVTPWLVTEAAALARQLDGRLVLLNVTRPDALRDDQAAFRKTMERLVERPLKPTAGDAPHGRAPIIHGEAISGDSLQLIGEPVQMILDQAGKLSADYIVMGSHGRSALHDLVFGSVAAGVLRDARCPVILVPSREMKSRNHSTG